MQLRRDKLAGSAFLFPLSPPSGNNLHCSRPLIARGRKAREGRKEGRKERIAVRGVHVKGRLGEEEKGHSKGGQKKGRWGELAGGVIRDLVTGTWKCKLRLSKTKV